MCMKTGVIDVGGGLRGIYAVGVMDYCMDCGIQFDLGIGISAGSASLSSFAAGQRDRNSLLSSAILSVYFGLARGLSLRRFFLTHTPTHTRKNCVETVERTGLETVCMCAGKGQKLLEISQCTRPTLFVISRSGIQVRSPAPNWAVRPEDEAGQPLYKTKYFMREFPSGQRGQTVNLLSTTSVVRIHSLPLLTKPCMRYARLLLCLHKLS